MGWEVSRVAGHQTHLAAGGCQGLGGAARILDPQLLSLVRMSGRRLTKRSVSHT